MQRLLGSGERSRVDQPFLVVEEVIDHRDVDAGVRSDCADRGQQSDTQSFVDDAGSCSVTKQLPAVAGLRSSVALPSVESSSAEAS